MFYTPLGNIRRVETWICPHLPPLYTHKVPFQQAQVAQIECRIADIENLQYFIMFARKLFNVLSQRFQKNVFARF